jgi:hypothetical protein
MLNLLIGFAPRGANLVSQVNDFSFVTQNLLSNIVQHIQQMAEIAQSHVVFELARDWTGNAALRFATSLANDAAALTCTLYPRTLSLSRRESPIARNSVLSLRVLVRVRNFARYPTPVGPCRARCSRA